MYIVGKKEYYELRIHSDVFVVFLKVLVLSVTIAGFWPSSEPGITWISRRNAYRIMKIAVFQRAVEIWDLFQWIS